METKTVWQSRTDRL